MFVKMLATKLSCILRKIPVDCQAAVLYAISTMNVKIEFHTDNAAFEDSFLMEITRVTRSIKDALIDSENTTGIRRPIKDSNGNRIGTVEISNQ
jgi:hypothetical protein